MTNTTQTRRTDTDRFRTLTRPRLIIDSEIVVLAGLMTVAAWILVVALKAWS